MSRQPNPGQPDRCPSIDPYGDLQCARRIHEDDQCQFGGIAWKKEAASLVTADDAINTALEAQVSTPTAAETAVLARAASLLAEIYEPAGVLIYWSARIRYLDDRRPCDLWRDRDMAALEAMCDRLDALCDGAFS